MYIYYTKSIERYNDNDINFGNFEVYEQLSKEFDLMRDIIQIIRKNAPTPNTFSHLFINADLKKEIKAKKDMFKNKTAIYRQIIHHLFNNNNVLDKNSNFVSFKRELISACYRENIKSVDLLTRQLAVSNDGLLFSLNEEEKMPF